MYNYGNSSWTDLLTSYNGQNITYDAIGNPTSYLGYTLKWNGRQLSSLSGNGTTASYKYDADGLRSYKKVNGVETTYQYVGDKLMYEKRGTTEFYYYYNSFGNLAGIKYVQNGTEYMVYAVCNMRGDVEDLYWGSGNLACHYTYDTWGNVISVTDINGKEITNANHIGLMNPIRYRGYYFDSEIGMYYLQSRYYNPQVGRFINSDDQIADVGGSVLGFNVFAYCVNNPVNMSDDTGNWPKWVGQATSWVNKKIIQPVKNFFSSTKQSSLVASSHDVNRRPYRGEPGSTYTAPNGDTRTYGPDGTPKHDYDHNDHGRPDKHPRDANGGHNHDWENGVRGPAYSINWKPILGIALVTVCIIGLAVVIADDFTGIGVADDFLYGPLGTGVGKGIIMIFG